MSSQPNIENEKTSGALAAWRPPARPEWVQRINDEGRCMDIRAVVPLDAASLLASAQHNTGLSDFGEDSWREPFMIIAKALDDEANLNFMGRLMCRSDMLHFLEGRLLIEDCYRKNPEIDDERVIKPFFIVGQGRSGTSALLNVMSKDPDNGSVKTWEAIFPCPPPETATYLTDPRIERGNALITQWNRVNPAFESLHEFAGDVPASCVHFMTFAFMSIWFNQLGQMPSYSKYCAQADWHQAFEYHKRVLKLLQWKNPRKHWVLKSPTHLRRLPTILDVYPDACFIWPHRDPVRAIVSSVDLAGNMIWARSDDNRMLGFEDFNRPERTADMLEQPIEWIETGRVPRGRICNINYVDLIADPVATVQGIYEYFGVELAGRAKAAMEDYMRANPRSSRPTHSLNEDVKQAISKERTVFSRYQRYFKVPSEI